MTFGGKHIEVDGKYIDVAPTGNVWIVNCLTTGQVQVTRVDSYGITTQFGVDSSDLETLSDLLEKVAAYYAPVEVAL